jgi:hypothetical protein
MCKTKPRTAGRRQPPADQNPLPASSCPLPAYSLTFTWIWRGLASSRMGSRIVSTPAL